MKVLKIIFFGFVLTEKFKSTIAMGLCNFAEKFPCKDGPQSLCFKNSGCTVKNPNKTQTVTITTDQVNTDNAETGRVITTNPSCPPNMLYLNCTTCQGTCMDPKECITDCAEPETCVCPEGFLFKGTHCVPEEECDCFVEGEGVIKEGAVYIPSDCSTQCSCIESQLVCNDTYECSGNAVCEARNGTWQCYCAEGYTGDGVICVDTSAPSDCLDVYNTVSTKSGVYTIKPWQGKYFDVYCNMSDGGGWTVFQRRVDGSLDFNLHWSDYKVGFGNPLYEHWLGNDKLHVLTNQKHYELRVDIVDRNGDPFFAKYNYFSIGDETNLYQLHLGNYSEGDAGDSFSYNDGAPFSTTDRDNDHSGKNCSTQYGCNCGSAMYQGSWWYYSCSYVALNNQYGGCCLEWRALPNNHYIQYTEMKVRPI